MDVTVVICTFNRARLLDAALEAMSHLRVPPGVGWELLVVDNNSSDDTPGVISAHASRLPLRGIRETAQGLSHARNRGLGEANGSLIAYTDDDTLVDVNWLASLLDARGRFPGAAAFGGPIAPWFPVRPDAAVAAAFPVAGTGFCALDYGLDLAPLAADREIYGANMAFDTGTIRPLGFRTDLGMTGTTPGFSEETHLVHRLRSAGQDVIWVPAMKVRHFVDPSRLTVRYCMDYYRGRGRTSIIDSGVPDGRRVLGVPAFVFRQLGETAAGIAYWGLRGNRVRRLICQRRFSFFRGMFDGCRMRSGHRA